MHRNQSLRVRWNRDIPIFTCLGPLSPIYFFFFHHFTHFTLPLPPSPQTPLPTPGHLLPPRIYQHCPCQPIPSPNSPQRLQLLTVSAPCPFFSNILPLPDPTPKETLLPLSQVHHLRGPSLPHVAQLGQVPRATAVFSGQASLLCEHQKSDAP